MKTYYTHDNGGKPFKVVIEDSEVIIHVYRLWNKKDAYSDEDDDGYYKHACYQSYKPLRIMIGESPQNPMTEYSGGYGPEFTGNSILVHEKNHNYVWIGERIIRFTTEVDIEEFVSPVGNNDMPYPWARDVLGNTYLFIENVILGPECQWEDGPYEYYRINDLITTDLGYVPPVKPTIRFRGVIGFRIGTENYTLRYQPHAGADYDRIMNWNEGNIVFKFNDKEKIMSRAEYIEFMEAFGQIKHFRPFFFEIIQPRLW